MSELTHPLAKLDSDDTWVAFVGPGLGFPDPVVCRVALIDGVSKIVDLHLGGGGQPIASMALREISLMSMSVAINSTLRSLDAMEAATPTQVVWPHATLLDLLADTEPTIDKNAPAPPPMVVLYGWRGGEVCYVGRTATPRIDWDRAQVLTEDFLYQVGEAYDAAVLRGESPAKSIAEATGASQKTVQSWIYKGRKRGVIAPAQGRGRIR